MKTSEKIEMFAPAMAKAQGAIEAASKDHRNPNFNSKYADLAAALAKAQGAVEGATKDSANPFFRSKYADLASVWDACRTTPRLMDTGCSSSRSDVPGSFG